MINSALDSFALQIRRCAGQREQFQQIVDWEPTLEDSARSLEVEITELLANLGLSASIRSAIEAEQEPVSDE